MSVIDAAIAKKLADALADGPSALFAVLSELFTAVPGIRTATFIATAPDRTVTHRIGTSNPRDFPIGNVDPVDDSPWNRRILVEKKPVIGDSVEGMAAFIPETDGLVAMGYGACSCFPIVIAGETRGVVALLGSAGVFTPAALAQIDALLPIAALTFTFAGISER
ncbi:MAG: GAF domain-containing protein [Devosia sp.]|uniref:GAF domain-containing protein n=1 Tax=Devosia sp. TaxID=1871048 RepID=UPI001ACCE656|nr:GAF domain-containing protein [Devosia sp.]MBN9316851.1 GAF domain-containing protein [Devosia sp.]